QLYRSFSSEGNPTLRTTFAVLQAVGIQLLATKAKTVEG
ncbi:MAG: transcriptional regulator, partial [Boseongicola sp. SB0670_bin_30]|nr:transcriptional regulator [Boseongicola sp. SB0670_bin_30]